MLVHLELTGTAPLIMHNIRMANPTDPIVRAHKVISSKRRKSDEDYEELARLEFMGSLYHRPGLGPFIPSLNIERAIVEAAKMDRGVWKTVQSAILIMQQEPQVIYKGPREPEELYADPDFVSIMMVRVQAARVARCRPIFPTWAIECDLELDTSMLDEGKFRSYIEEAGRTKALGDYRPRFGRFSVEVTHV